MFMHTLRSVPVSLVLLATFLFGAQVIAAGPSKDPANDAKKTGEKKTGEKKSDETKDYGSTLSNEMQACNMVCLDELDLVFFGTLTVPFQRPSTEYCGELLSMSAEQRAAQDREALAAVEKEASSKRYSPKERADLRRKALEKTSRCDSDLKKRCEEARAKFPLDARKNAVAKTRQAIAGVGEAGRGVQIGKYLAAILAKCPLDQ